MARRVLAAAFGVYALHVVALLWAEVATAGQVGPPIDDGWIYMAFARSLAEGEGITYPGHDGPLCAVTGPVWNAVLALAFVCFGASAVVAKSVGIVTGGFALWAVYRLGGSATGDARVGAISALVMAFATRFVWGSSSVMEVPFFVAAVAWGLALHLDRRRSSLVRWLPALVVLWLSGWARPECFVFPVLAALHRREWRAVVVLAALLALYPAYHLWAYGHPLPTTFYAKASGGAPWSILVREGFGAALLALVWHPVAQVIDFIGYLPTFLPLLALGTVHGVRRAIRERSGVGFVAFALVAFVVARGVLGTHLPSFQYGRYYGHVVAMFVVVSVYGFDLSRRAWRDPVIVLAVVGACLAWFPAQTLAYVFDWITPEPVDPSGAPPLVVRTAPITLAVAPALAFVVFAWGGVRARPALPAPVLALLFLGPAIALGAVRHGRNVNDTYTMNVAMAQAVRQHVPEGEQVACHDIGAIGFFSDRLALDLAGLGSPEVVFGPRTPEGKIDGRRILMEAKPRYVCLTIGMFDSIVGGAQDLPGLRGFELLHTIEHPDNITLLGTTYFLAELRWN